MDEMKTHANQKPAFGSLTEIMQRFAQVPYEQFQQELHEWFYISLSEKGIDVQQLQEAELPDLPSLISAIYHEAELRHLLNDHSISDEPKDK